MRADIGQFYPSIYTHAIPWALHTKAACKANLRLPRGVRRAFFGDELDTALRAMNDGQSIGIPIGPDTSLVIAEILLTAIDEALFLRCPGLIRGFRHVDDYELSFIRLSEAETVRTALQGLLAEYELYLNPIKTGLLELPTPLEDNWSIDLRTFTIRNTGPQAQRTDILGLFSKALELAAARPTDSVLRYAVARVSNIHVFPGAWRTFQNSVLSAASADPSTLPAVLGALYEVGSKRGHTVSRFPLHEVFESLILAHAPQGQGSEVAWALWGALAWNVALSENAATLVSELEDDIVALLSLHADQQGLFPTGSLNTAKWANLIAQPDVLQGEHWLLAYEANQQGWLRTRVIAADPIFTAVSGAGVNFYDTSEAVPQFPAGGRGIPGGKLQPYYA
ncbi:MAG TPA: RNA-directed DNA polymerase [Pyrinomonadaceae bacterium]|nr:RNA-directed DNA polymerase [Pyrinomonadaceae bacterium]